MITDQMYEGMVVDVPEPLGSFSPTSTTHRTTHAVLLEKHGSREGADESVVPKLHVRNVELERTYS